MDTVLQSTLAFLPALQQLDQIASPRVSEHALKEAGLTRAVMEDPTVFLPYRLQARFMQAASLKISEKHIGAYITQDFHYASFGAYADYVLGAPKLDAALARAEKILPFLQRGSVMRTRVVGDHFVLGFDAMLGGIAGANLIDQDLPFVLQSVVREFCGRRWRPSWVEMPEVHRGTETALQYIYNAEVRVGGSAASIAIPLSEIETPNPRTTDERLAMTLAGIRDVRSRQTPSTTKEVVGNALRAQLAMGHADIETVAATLGVSVRKLQRQLTAENTNFKEIRVTEQTDRARSLLSGTDLSVAEVAFNLGFSEVNSFRRTFASWFGISPSKFRKLSGT
ncbi:helix-turn-helix transcriptional regulator [Ruegeria atlantica]|uniref:helix-turn-helix transcriptional regulator n=1 Tax=Ruegeria atlantica TaxID=81569 RepID=UPI002494FA73|nr:AraC family transcriptional regulator [Ruegeria atlantica]